MLISRRLGLTATCALLLLLICIKMLIKIRVEILSDGMLSLKNALSVPLLLASSLRMIQLDYMSMRVCISSTIFQELSIQILSHDPRFVDLVDYYLLQRLKQT